MDDGVGLCLTMHVVGLFVTGCGVLHDGCCSGESSSSMMLGIGRGAMVCGCNLCRLLAEWVCVERRF